MKHLFTFLWLILGLVSVSASAQKQSAKVYLANVSASKVPANAKDLKRRNDEITFQAKSKVNNLRDMLNTLTNSSLTESERNAVVQNSYLPNPNQLFFNDQVLVEDDVDPNHTSAANVAELPVERYLRDVDLFYSKADTTTIDFTRIVFSPVQDGPDYPYIKVFFTKTLAGKHNQINTPYVSISRVAELRAENVGGKWRVFITRLAFVRDGEGLSEIGKPVISKGFGPERPISGPLTIFRKANSPTDSLKVIWDTKWLNVSQSSVAMVPVGFYQRSGTDKKDQSTVSITLLKKDQKLSFQRIDGVILEFNRTMFIDSKADAKHNRIQRLVGWSEIATGLIGLGVSYAGYSSLQNDYKAYTNKLTGLNAEYAIWQTLTQQNAGSTVTTMPFNEYASPGVYAAYGGGIVGGGLVIDGIRRLLKAGKKTSSAK